MSVFRGTVGDDTITGSSGNDNFLLWQGGSDTVDGGGGNDIFRMGAALNAGDKIDGGTGEDVITLAGDYSAGLVFNADTIANIEVMGLGGGHSYNLTLNDGNVATGERLLVKAQALGAGDQLTFDGSAETDGNYYIIAGAGNDSLTGGAKHDVFDLSHGGNDTAHGGGGNDTFYLGAAFTAADAIDGGAGNDTLELNGDELNVFFGPNTITNVETLKFDNGHRYQITTNDGNVASGQTLTVDFSAMTSKQFVFNGSAELDGNFRFVFGAANVLLHGGNGNDIFDATHAGNASVELYGNGGDDTFLVGADFNHVLVFSLDGGSGNDTIEFNGDYPSLVEVGIETTSVETIRFDGGHTYSNVVIAEPGAATIDTSQVSTLFHLAFTNGNYTIEVGSGGMIASPYDSSSHDNTFIVTSEASLAASTLDAGNGSDTLELNGDFSLGITLGATTNFETITVADGHSYSLGNNDANVASGATLTVDGSALTGGNTLEFSGTAETDGHFAFIAGAGADLLEGGSQSDTFDLSRSDGAFAFGNGGNDTFTVTSAAKLADDFIDGGANSDTLALNGDFSAATTITASNVNNIETLQLLGAANSYNLTIAGGGVTGAGTFTIDASAAASLAIDLSGTTSSAYVITGSAGNDSFILSGSGANSVTAGLGADSIACGAGADTIVTGAVADSTGAGGYDTIDAFNFDADKFNLAGAHTVTNIHGTSAFVDSTTFDANLTAASVGHLSDDGVLIVSATTGNLSGHIFIVVDVNNDGLYQAGADYVFDVSTAFGTIDTGDFI